MAPRPTWFSQNLSRLKTQPGPPASSQEHESSLNASTSAGSLGLPPQRMALPQITAGVRSSLRGQPGGRNFKAGPCRKGSSITSLSQYNVFYISQEYILGWQRLFLPWLPRCVEGCDSWCLLTQNQCSRREHYFSTSFIILQLGHDKP